MLFRLYLLNLDDAYLLKIFLYALSVSQRPDYLCGGNALMFNLTREVFLVIETSNEGRGWEDRKCLVLGTIRH